MNNKFYTLLSVVYVATVIWFAHSIMYYDYTIFDDLAAPSYIVISIITAIVSGYYFAKKNHRIPSAILFLMSFGLLAFTAYVWFGLLSSFKIL